MDSKIDTVYRKLDAKIDKIDAKIDSVYIKLDAKITQQIDLTGRMVNKFANDITKRVVNLELARA
ncbi:MAG: hypothetical protein WCO25_03795 [Candidatus Uhrbacteria bacterium]